MFVNINVLVIVLYFYGHDPRDQKMGAWVTDNTRLDFFLPVLTFSSPFPHVAPATSWAVPIVDSLINFCSDQSVLFQGLVTFLVLTLLSCTVFREMSKECGFWVYGYFIC